MPTPGRGTAVLHVGEILNYPNGYLAEVAILDGIYWLPWVQHNEIEGSVYVPSGNNQVWVLFVGRTGLILGRVGYQNLPT